jgi:hypothetical protein
MINRFIISPQIIYNFKKDFNLFMIKDNSNRNLYEFISLLADFTNILFYISDHIIALYSLDIYKIENSK